MTLFINNVRGLSRIEAAKYVGVSASTFDKLVFDRRMPYPRLINSRRIYDIHELDAAFDRLPRDGSSCNDGENPLDRVVAI